MTKILVVDDEANVQRLLQYTLKQAGYTVSVAGDGQEALKLWASEAPGLILLDVSLPKLDGYAVAERIRADEAGKHHVPIIMLTSEKEVEQKVRGLRAGADDYLVKPFDVGELQARLRALLRRSRSNGDADGQSFHELRLDGDRHGVSVGEGFVELTRTEYQLLELLMLNSGRVLPHNLIYERVWGYDFGPASNALRVYIGYLRRKLDQAGARPLLHTVRGVGYVLREP